MGYDSRLYIIRKTDTPTGKKGKFKYAETMAIYEMCVFPPFHELFNNRCPVTEYAPCSKHKNIIKDMYGYSLREGSIEEVIECLEQVIILNDSLAHYARVRPLLALLQEYKKYRVISISWLFFITDISHASKILYGF